MHWARDVDQQSTFLIRGCDPLTSSVENDTNTGNIATEELDVFLAALDTGTNFGYRFLLSHIRYLLFVD